MRAVLLRCPYCMSGFDPATRSFVAAAALLHIIEFVGTKFITAVFLLAMVQWRFIALVCRPGLMLLRHCC